MIQSNQHTLTGIAPFEYKIEHIDIDATAPSNVHEQHTHSVCELYVNLSGEISFMCGDSIYPVGPGQAIIARPYEPHHCIYRANSRHRHYWMLFSCDAEDPFFDFIYRREQGIGNLITLTDEGAAEMVSLCRSLLTDKTGSMETCMCFMRLMQLLASGRKSGRGDDAPEEIRRAISHISENLAEPLAIGALAAEAHMSLSSFERRFKAHTGMTPKQYILGRRLSRSAELLAGGMSVMDVCTLCGFPDYSHFIALFRRRFGTTPLRYQKEHA